MEHKKFTLGANEQRAADVIQGSRNPGIPEILMKKLLANFLGLEICDL